jgi:hypothetical protein
MIHVVVIKYLMIPFTILVGLPLLIHIELLWRSQSQKFKNWGVRVGGFVYWLHSSACTCPEPDEYGPRDSMHVVKKLMSGAVYIQACFYLNAIIVWHWIMGVSYCMIGHNTPHSYRGLQCLVFSLKLCWRKNGLTECLVQWNPNFSLFLKYFPLCPT